MEKYHIRDRMVQSTSFICFDIEELYPSISQDLLSRALDFALAYENITSDEGNIIIHAKNSVLIHDILRYYGKLRHASWWVISFSPSYKVLTLT